MTTYTNPVVVQKNQFGETSINAIAPGTSFPSSFKSLTVTLSAAQVIALNATPITLVSGVVGKVISVEAVVMNYIRVATFGVTAAKILKAQYATSAVVIGSVLLTGFLDQATSKEAVVYGTGVGGVGIRGQAVQISSDDTGITLGTGSTVTVTVYYNILT